LTLLAVAAPESPLIETRAGLLPRDSDQPGAMGIRIFQSHPSSSPKPDLFLCLSGAPSHREWVRHRMCAQIHLNFLLRQLIAEWTVQPRLRMEWPRLVVAPVADPVFGEAVAYQSWRLSRQGAPRIRQRKASASVA
jgi:hypothetical protein